MVYRHLINSSCFLRSCPFKSLNFRSRTGRVLIHPFTVALYSFMRHAHLLQAGARKVLIVGGHQCSLDLSLNSAPSRCVDGSLISGPLTSFCLDMLNGACLQDCFRQVPLVACSGFRSRTADAASVSMVHKKTEIFGAGKMYSSIRTSSPKSLHPSSDVCTRVRLIKSTIRTRLFVKHLRKRVAVSQVRQS